MAYNPLDERPQIRKVLYLVQWICNGLIGAASIVFLAQSDNPPRWFTIVVAVLAFLWTYTGLTAQGNTPIGGVPGNPEPLQPDEGGAVGFKGDTGWKNEAGYSGLINAIVAIVALIVLVWLVVFVVRALTGA